MKRITSPLRKGKCVLPCYVINWKELNLNGTRTWNWNRTGNVSLNVTWTIKFWVAKLVGSGVGNGTKKETGIKRKGCRCVGYKNMGA